MIEVSLFSKRQKKIERTSWGNLAEKSGDRAWVV